MSEIFNIRHEVDLSEYTSTDTDGGKLSQSAPGLVSTAGKMQALIDDTTTKYGEKTFTQLTSANYRLRFYIDPNGLTMANNDLFGLCALNEAANVRLRIFMTHDLSSHEIRATLREDDTSWEATNDYNITDEEHYIEVLVEYASSAVASDGALTLWIDGDLKEEVSGIDIYDLSKPDLAQLGAGVAQTIEATTTGTLLLDEFVLRDDDTEIGPVVALAGYTLVF